MCRWNGPCGKSQAFKKMHQRPCGKWDKAMLTVGYCFPAASNSFKLRSWHNTNDNNLCSTRPRLNNVWNWETVPALCDRSSDPYWTYWPTGSCLLLPSTCIAPLSTRCVQHMSAYVLHGTLLIWKLQDPFGLQVTVTANQHGMLYMPTVKSACWAFYCCSMVGKVLIFSVVTKGGLYTKKHSQISVTH